MCARMSREKRGGDGGSLVLLEACIIMNKIGWPCGGIGEERIYLSKKPYLEGKRTCGHDHCDDNIEDEIETVFDEPVGPAAQSVLLHHDQMFLITILHQHRNKHLQ